MEQPKDESIFQEEEFALKGYDKHIKNARFMLFVIAGLQLFGVFTALGLPDPARWITIAIYVFFGGVFAALAFWTHKKPFTALLVALILYGSLLVLDGIFEPSSIYKGIIIKVAIIIMLITGLRNAKEAQDMKNTFGGNS